MEYYSAMERKRLLTHTTWMNHESYLLYDSIYRTFWKGLKGQKVDQWLTRPRVGGWGWLQSGKGNWGAGGQWISWWKLSVSWWLCKFLLCAVLSSFSCIWFCATLWNCSLPGPWASPGKKTGMGHHALLQEIFLTQGSKLQLISLLRWQAAS